MPAADRCHLEIPWKEWAKLLADVLADVEGVDQTLLQQMGDQEFENYKKIERRINDDTCGGCCDDIFVGTGGSGSIAPAGLEVVTFAAGGDSGTIYPSSGTSTLAAGVWSIHGTMAFFPDDPATGTVDVYFTPSPSPSQGGFVSGLVNVTSVGDNFGLAFNGMVVMNTSFTPEMTVQSNLDESMFAAGRYYAHRICDPCGYTIHTK